MPEMAPSFATDIRPLFRVKDIRAMKSIAGFDLSRYEDAKSNAGSIYPRLANGSMPCDGAWPSSQITLFKAWIDGGFRP
jgi:hypothetical protein